MRKRVSLTAALAVLLLALCGCNPPAPEENRTNEARIDALEAEVQALRRDETARDKRFSDELARVRESLESIRALLEIDRARTGDGDAPGKSGADKPGPGEPPSDEELDAKAKTFVGENLDRLLDLTRKLLDRMESELDDKLKEPGEPPAEGHEI
ncbi:hypothetical protein [Pseudodesulfovibrio indicus]|uniref:hypothetical protein n=1 Tax=Pseudodesulfovibrio indicus TaxID=1716143 RepID=UPI0029305EB0|nr:hypothetical protein [Pseudodesulfovibrio indicus]